MPGENRAERFVRDPVGDPPRALTRVHLQDEVSVDAVGRHTEGVSGVDGMVSRAEGRQREADDAPQTLLKHPRKPRPLFRVVEAALQGVDVVREAPLAPQVVVDVLEGIEDMLRLAMSSEKPLLRGAMRLQAKLVIPPVKKKVIEKMELEGDFGLSQAAFSDPKVRAELDRMLLLQVDVTANNENDKALLKRFSLFGPPGIIFFDPQGREIKGLRVIGYQPPERFLKTLSLATAP